MGGLQGGSLCRELFGPLPGLQTAAPDGLASAHARLGMRVLTSLEGQGHTAGGPAQGLIPT